MWIGSSCAQLSRTGRCSLVRVIRRAYARAAAAQNDGVLVVGGGRMGSIRATSFLGSRRLALAGLIDSDATRAADLAKMYTNTPVYTDLPAALSELKGVRGVWLSTPTHTHRDAIKTVAEAGLAVGVEKPVAGSVQETIQCYEIAEQHGVPLFCSFQRRSDPSYQRLANVVRSGKIGHVKAVHAIFRDHPVPPIDFLKTGGDIYVDLVVHDADFIMNLLAEVPQTVYAQGSSFHAELREIGVNDYAFIMMQFRSGILATIELSRSSSYGYDQRLEVYGSEGAVQVTNPPETHVVVSSQSGITEDTPMHSFPQRFAEAYSIEADRFANVLEGKECPIVTLEDSVNCMLVAEACGRSATEGKPVAVKSYT